MEINQKIFDKIDQMYNRLDDNGKQKNKAFFTHLVKSYFPASKVKIAFDRPIDSVKVECVFTKNKLLTVPDVMELINTTSFKDSVMDYLSSFDKVKCQFTSPTPMSQITGGKPLAITGTATETFMTQESYAAFFSWLSTKYLTGDGHIKWLMNQVADNPFAKSAPRGPLDKPAKMKTSYSTDSKKSTLGDLSVLQELKNKLKNKE